MRGFFQYVFILIPVSFRAALASKSAFLTMAIVMGLQNILMFMIWVIYFDNFSSLRGWQLEDMATLYGLAAFAFGMAFVFTGGVFDIGRSILNGELDIYLGRPRHPLTGLLFRESRAMGIGDIISALILWALFTEYSVIEYAALLILAFSVALITLATCLAINCLAFFSEQGSRMSDQLLEAFTIIAVYPQNGFHMGLKMFLLTVIPAGFVAYLPVEAIRNFNVIYMFWVIFAAGFYMTLSVWIFNRGLKRYTSGNKMLEVR